MTINSSGQDNFVTLRSNAMVNFGKALNFTQANQRCIFAYGSPAIKEAIEARKKIRPEHFHPEFMPDFTQYQYDMEMFIFLNYAELYKRDLEISSPDRVKILEASGPEYGATFLKREEHLANAIKIRWPEKTSPTGAAITAYALTPWAKDYLYGLSNFQNIIAFGGGGQGKTYSPLAFQVLLFDHFIFTKSGAQCSSSTVSETKLKSSIWSHLCKLYSYRNPYKFSLYAGEAHQAPEYTFRRKKNGKYIEEGGTIKGILLVNGAKTARQIDKLTGQHDVIARAYLLDEAQSTGSAPLSAYNNMYLHPIYKWFMMCGNYELDSDLLGLNTEPAPGGWQSVDEKTHMWQSTLKSPDSDLGHESLVIHYNNDLSPAFFDPEIKKRYGRFLPTPEKKASLYKDEAAQNTYEAKRFWIGFRFERKEEKVEKVLTFDILAQTKCSEEVSKFTTPLFVIASFDNAQAEGDDNVLTLLNVGLCEKGYPLIWPRKIIQLPISGNSLNYYKITCARISEILKHNEVMKGHSIIDWTNRTQILEGVNDLGHGFYPLIYSQKLSKDEVVNEVTKTKERPIQIGTVKLFNNNFETEVKTFAHEKMYNKITTAAYIFRQFIDHGRFRGLNASMLEGLRCKSFENEMMLRYFEKKMKGDRELIILNDKANIRRTKKFSPDILDTLFQAAFLLQVHLEVYPDRPGLGLMRREEQKKKPVDNTKWRARLNNLRSTPIIRA